MADDKKDSKIDENIEIGIVADTALLPVTGPMGVSDGTIVEDFSTEDTTIYVARKGDTPKTVADLFDVSVATILSVNGMKAGDLLKEGDVLLILPFSAVEHTVVKGETLKGIANKYKVDLEEILSANDIDESAKIAIGGKLMIPGGEMIVDKKPKSSTGNIAKGKINSSLPSVSGFFKNPVPGARRTRGIITGKNKHNGVDLAAPTGTPIYAAASGTAIIARNGYNGGFGNYVVLQHSNGTKTLYAHMSRLGTTPGAKVSQGEVIGYVGNTGHSFGAHLHIEVLGAKNPF